jgi:hypothetical protein
MPWPAQFYLQGSQTWISYTIVVAALYPKRGTTQLHGLCRKTDRPVSKRHFTQYRNSCVHDYLTVSWRLLPLVPSSFPMGTRGSFPGGKADHLPPSSAEVKNSWNYTSTPHYAFKAWCSVNTGRTSPLPFTASLFTRSWTIWTRCSSSASMGTRLLTVRPGFHFRQVLGLFSPRNRIQTGSGAYPPSYLMGTGGEVAGAWNWPLTLHLVPMLRMRGTIPPLPPQVLIAWYLVKTRDKFTLRCRIMYACRS